MFVLNRFNNRARRDFFVAKKEYHQVKQKSHFKMYVYDRLKNHIPLTLQSIIVVAYCCQNLISIEHYSTSITKTSIEETKSKQVSAYRNLVRQKIQRFLYRTHSTTSFCLIMYNLESKSTLCYVPRISICSHSTLDTI